MQNSFRLPLQMLSNISCTRTLRCQVWSWGPRYTGQVKVIWFMQNIFRCNPLPRPPSNHHVLKCSIHIAAQRQASNIAQLDAGYVSEVHNSHICSATLDVGYVSEVHNLHNLLAASDTEYVSEVHNSHSCATPGKQTSRIRRGIRIRNAQFA